jgi:PhzF family phenazine biosynthesis protein
LEDLLRTSLVAVPEQFVINAFDRGPFTGNPAAVVPLDDWPADSTLQSIAAQNNLSETAFFVDSGATIKLRWFTPTQEIDLCGHATLATAHAIFEEASDPRELLVFSTLSGELRVEREGDEYRMDFPHSPPIDADFSAALEQAVLSSIGVEAGEVFESGGYPLVVLPEPSWLRELSPDLEAISRLPHGHLLATAPGDNGFDALTRVFAPGVGIPEDPATGSAHCAFAPYWSEVLGKEEITSFQASARGGYFTCRWRKDDGRVDLIGSCSTFSRGEISI